MTVLSSSMAPTLDRLLGFHANQTPNAPALLAPDRQPLPYGRLLTHIREIVHTLNAWGIGRQDCVALVLPNGPEMATAFLALATGVVSAPLNPDYRVEEFEFYLSDCKAKAVLVPADQDSPARAVARTRGIALFELLPQLDAEAGLFTLRGEPCDVPAPETSAQPKDTALVLHTSGTTARPKLVPLTHANICASATFIANTLALGSRDRCLNVMPLFHIHGLVGALLSSLAAGGSVVNTPGFSVQHFLPWLEAFRPTWYTAVPTIHHTIVTYTQQQHALSRRFPLRFIRSSSAALPSAVLTQLESVFRVPVIEAYGMTEAAHQMASNPLPPEQRKMGSVGKATGSDIAITDETGAFLAPEVVGEVVIRGANVTAGYVNNPEANATAFTQGWFRTGDQGYLDSDGYLFLTGRLKEVINRGGEKIAPREVDDVLLAHPAVAQAVTFPVPHPTLGEDVAAAVVLHAAATATEATLRQYLFERLAGFKIPSQVLIVDEIPQSPTGKVQRLGLAARFAQQFTRPFVAPRNDLEKMIVTIYEEVLGRTRIGVGDNFFALGGDSLRATRVISRLRATFQINLPIVTLFRKPTIAELAEEITHSLEAGNQTAMEEILAELATLSDEEARRLLETEPEHPSSVLDASHNKP